MERVCLIASTAAAVLTIPAALLDTWAIVDWRQNAIDTAAMITSVIWVAAWLFTAMAWQDMKTRHRLEAFAKTATKRIKADASLRRLSLDQPTEPLTVPPHLRRVQ